MAQNNTKAAAITVVTIESNLFLSRKIPIMPTSKAAGNENIISNPPRAANGLPQPGCNIKNIRIVAAAIPRKVAEIFPKCISNLS
jgi:hypothetical protein